MRAGGKPVRDWRRLDLAALKGRTLINGAEVGNGTGAMVLGPSIGGAGLACQCAGGARIGLKRGEFVFLGSLVETKWLNAGDHVRIEIEELGEVEVEVE